MASPSDELKNGLMREGCFAARIIVALMLDAIIIAVMMAMFYLLNRMAEFLDLADESTVQLILEFSHTFYLVVYIVIAIIFVISIVIEGMSNSKSEEGKTN